MAASVTSNAMHLWIALGERHAAQTCAIDEVAFQHIATSLAKCPRAVASKVNKALEILTTLTEHMSDEAAHQAFTKPWDPEKIGKLPSLKKYIARGNFKAADKLLAEIIKQQNTKAA